MNNLIKINNQDIQVKEFNGQRVVTFKDIDILHQRAEGTAKRNFNENKVEADGITERFIKGTDYFEITKKEVGTNFVQSFGFEKFAPSGILITESGYLMLVKSFTDDLAWKVQRELINNYFKRQIIIQNQEAFSAIKVELQDEIQTLVKNGIDEVKRTCSDYYRPAAVEKYNVAKYIKKSLGIQRADEEFELVKQRILILLQAQKWEDIPIEVLRAPETLNLIDQSIDIVRKRRQTAQISIFDNIQG